MVRGYYQQFKQLSSNVKIFLLGNAIQGMGMSIHGLLFNLYLKELGFGESAIGGLISTTSLGISLMAIPAALIVEGLHVKHLVVTGMLMSSLFYFGQVIQTNESILFTFGLLASMFQALFNISVSPFYLRNTSRKDRVYVFTLNSFLNIGAHLIGYLVGGYLPAVIKRLMPIADRVEQYQFSMISAIGLVLLSNLVFMRIKPVPIPKVKRKLFEGLKEREWNTLSKLILPKLCLAFGGGLIVPFLNLYLKEKFDLSTKMIGVAYAVLQLFIVCGIFITPQIMRRTTPLMFIMLTSFFAVPFMVSMGLVGSVGAVLGCFFMRGMLMNMSSPITSMFEMEHVKEKECVFASAIIIFFYHLVYTSSTRLGGFLIEKYSFGPTFYVAGTFYALAAVLYYYFFKNETRVIPEKVETPRISEAA